MEINLKKAKEALSKLKQNPNLFIEKILGHNPYDRQREINDAIAKYDRVAIRACHASGKSYDLADIALWWLHTRRNSVLLSTAPTFRQVEQILWRNIRTAHASALVPLGSTITNTKIEFEGFPNWFGLGLSTDHPEQFQGYHSGDILIIVDEASGVDQKIFEAIDGILSGGNAKIVMIGNPTRLSGSFYDAFKSSIYTKLHISALDTPNVKEGKIVINGLVTKDWVKEMETKYGKDSDVYRVRVLGQFPKAEEDTLISIDLVEEAIKRIVKVDGTIYAGHDVARFGDDSTVIAVRQGLKVLEIIKRPKLSVTENAGLAKEIMRKHKISPENYKIDVIGVGGGVVDILQEEGLNVVGVNVGEKPIEDEERFENLRAEQYWVLKDYMKEMDVPKDEDIYQLANIKYKFNKKGKIQIESKEDMKKRGLKSPDVADAIMLAYANCQNTLNIDFI